MTKIVKSIQIPINDVTPQSPNGYGVLYASASDNDAGYTIQYTNTAGETYDLTKSTSYYNVVYFTGSADRTDITYTWNPPPGLRYLEVCAVGAGGGGGLGGQTTATTNQGGCGGGGGAVIWAKFPAFLLTDSEYRIGIQRGGAGATTTSIGTNGGTSSFSDTSGKILVLADGGKVGPNGLSFIPKASAGGYISASIPIGSGLNGCGSGLGVNLPTPTATLRNALPIFNNISTINGSNTSVGEFGNGGGAGGMGGFQTGSFLKPGTSGSDGYQHNKLLVNNKNGTSFPGQANSTGGDGTDNLVTTLLRISGSEQTLYGLGGGGHGGGASLSIGGNGGNAGFYGAGGGGGGGVLNVAGGGIRPGSGGSGSAGLVILTEYFF